MDASIRQETLFHLTGQRPAATLDAIEGLRLRPALLARYRDLTRLRYDFPVVLVDAGQDGSFVRSLSEIVDDMLRQVAPPGVDGEGLRKHVLAVERGIRRLLADGASGSLSALWERAVQMDAVGEGAGLARYLEEAGASLGVDGAVLDCDACMPRRLIAHAWRVAQRHKARQRRSEINRLIVRLDDMLRADFVKSEAGSRPESLKASLGDRHHGLFDFEAMSRLLGRASHGAPLPAGRRARIERVLATLRSQRFFAAAEDDPAARAGAAPFEFEFATADEVLAAFRERLPQLIELTKALAIAELEADGRYVEATHDAFFATFGEAALGPDDLARFPDYLVCLKAGSAPAGMALMELLSSGVPVKVLVEVDDLLEDASLGAGRFAFGVRNVQIASMALGLTDTFVLQSSSSNLLRMRRAIARGMATPGAALFSVFSPSASAVLPGYLVSAAAMQSRAFPAFVHDPGAGPDLAERFSVADNPDPAADWAEASFEYADADLQRVRERLAFTFVDFLACDPRHAGHFARLPHAAWRDELVPVAEWLSRPDAAGAGHVPFLLAVDDRDVLQKVVVDERANQAARRCRDAWRRLQELGGVRSSHADRLLARERAAWEQRDAAAVETRPVDGVPAAAAASQAAASAAAAEEAEPSRSPDEAYIETLRCSSCNECTQINSRMFAYNADKQAYIADVTAGTFRQLVEAAESCQLGIIHPGKPRNPQEPGLEELMERARPFA